MKITCESSLKAAAVTLTVASVATTATTLGFFAWKALAEVFKDCMLENAKNIPGCDGLSFGLPVAATACFVLGNSCVVGAKIGPCLWSIAEDLGAYYRKRKVTQLNDLQV